MRSHPKKLHLLMPDAAPRGDSLHIPRLIWYILVTITPCPTKNTRCVADDGSNVIKNVTTRDDAECGGEY